MAVVPLQATVPAMLFIPSFTINVAIVTVESFMASEKVTLIAALKPTSVALFSGLVELTVGGVVSGAVPVVNDHV